MNDEALGPLLRRLRLERDLTLEGLAERSGVSDRTISDIERAASLGPQRRTVELLADALGLDADGRTALLAAARAGRHRRPEAPDGRAQIPRAVADFTGRSAELDRLLDLVRSARPGEVAPVAVVHGPPGFGKTSLAVRTATLVAPEVDGTYFVDLRGFDSRPLSALDVLTRLIGAVDPAVGKVPRRTTDAAGIWHQLVAGRRLLLVLDNAATEDQVRAVLPRLAPTAAIVTSRRPLAGLETVNRLAMSPLGPAESVELLRRIVPGQQLEGQDLERFAAVCHHVPLALRIAGNRLASREAWSADDLVARLADEDRRLDGLRAGDLDLRGSIALSYERLDPRARRAFRRLAHLEAASFCDAACAHLADTDLRGAEDLLDELADLGLVQGAAQGRFLVHDLLRLFARERLIAEEDAGSRTQVADRLRHWLLGTTIQAGRWFEPGFETAPADPDPLVDLSTSGAAQAWLQAEADHWLAAFRHALQAGEHALVVEVAEALHWFSDRWAHWGHWHEVFAAAVAASRAVADDDLLATQLGYLAWAELVTRSDPATALVHAREAHTVAVRAGNTRQEGWALFYEAWAHYDTATWHDALAFAARSADTLRRAGDLEGELQARRHEAIVLRHLGRYDESLATEREVLELIDAAGPTLSRQVASITRTAASVSIAMTLVQRERWDEVVAHATVAIDLQEASPVASLHLRALRSRSDAHRALGRVAEARADLEAALEVCAVTGDLVTAGELRLALDRLRDTTTPTDLGSAILGE